MSTHAFLQNQGVEVAPPYMKLKERMNHKLLLEHGIDLGDYNPYPFPMIIGSYNCDFVELTLHDGKIINENILNVTIDDRLLVQQQKHCRRISECLESEDSMKSKFTELRAKWNIPVDNQRAFFYELSSGYHDLFLPNVVVDEDLKADIGNLCGLFNLRKESSEEFGMVAAYLLFSEFIEQEDVGVFSIQSPRLFKVTTDLGYKLFLELQPSLQEMTWAKLYKGTRGTLKANGFIPGEGNMGLLSILADAIPEEFRHCQVFSIPRVVWKKFKPVRSYIDGVYGKNYILRDEEPGKISKYVIRQLAMASLAGRDNDWKLFKEISDWINNSPRFRPEGSTRDIEYSENAVSNVFKRYPDRIEREKLILICDRDV